MTAVIITYNEEENIARCLQPLQHLVDEVLVLDAFSKDKTVELARKMGARVLQKEWISYSFNKNYANAQAKSDWILSIDADEVLDEQLINTLHNLRLEEQTVYAVNRIVNWHGKWVNYSGWHPDWKVRLFNRKDVHWRGDFVHETLQIPAHFKIEKLEGLVHHYSYKNDADHWKRIEQYANLAAKEMQQKGKKASFMKLYLSPLARFIRTFFIKKGFLDGQIGWTISCRNAYLVHRKYQLLKQFNSTT